MRFYDAAIRAVVALAVLLGVAYWMARRQPVGVSATPGHNHPSAPWFPDVTVELGLHFEHDAGAAEKHFFPQIMGSGAAFLDYDNDGRLDIYLLQCGGPDSKTSNRLFHQDPDGRFSDVSHGSGLDVAGYSMGVAIGDINNDGLPDVLLTEYGRLRLFLNEGAGAFTDISQEAGLESALWGMSAAFVDYDRDGWLDLAVANYVEYNPHSVCTDSRGKPDFCGPKGLHGVESRLYHNQRDAGTTPGRGVRFEDVTIRSGIGRLTGPGLGVVSADFDGDHWPDILVANDGWPNYLWINQRDGTFVEEALVRGIAYDSSGRLLGNMGVAIGDLDGQGLFDVYITHLAQELHTCWSQGPQGYFQDKTAARGMTNLGWRSTGFGAVMADFDCDGDLDIAIANGAVQNPLKSASAPAQANSYWETYAERNQLFVNDGAGRFRDVSDANPPFCGTAAVSRGLAFGDLTGRGDLALLVNRTAASAQLFRAAVRHGHWLLVRVIEPALGGRDAYGAEVTVETDGRRWKRWVNPGSSYLSSNDPRADFGLGSTDHVESIRVLWPDGAEELFPGGATDRLVILRKGEGHSSTGD